MAMTPTEAEAYAAALSSQQALTTAATNVFIANAVAVINDAISQGKYQVILNHVENVSFKTVMTYFQGFGYTVGRPSCPYWEFGYFYGQYWIGWYYKDNLICNCGRPCKILISWQNPPSGDCGPVPWPGNGL